ncbi:kinase-like domain-containing protein [Rhizophagus irregularis DAOM 181602=DAOM 197198]|uniref:Uncharacterized protein n=1 Tax=Rhizophagus irregularis (strain DAOM 197198w) TaxID=1432141 RepID=A0A015IBD9_RHIIW|nr:hypothetical protein RirG_233910 [Rhizophagus irregularis DAOM 197198w]GBC27328.2 kinase-like domain-containing protein [Rhizophagus irregularis DAOM 181602=DAOM 197198]
MSTLRQELIYATNNKALMLTDTNIYNDIHKQFEFKKQTFLADKILTSDEKTVVIRSLTGDYDLNKVRNNSGTKRICENCNKECLATLYCEYCVRNYLKENFSNWTSGNDDGFSKIYTAVWINGYYEEWDSEKKIIKRIKREGIQSIMIKVVPKTLENVESANQSWFKKHVVI